MTDPIYFIVSPKTAAVAKSNKKQMNIEGTRAAKAHGGK
jgi:hypothetical protein